MERQIKKIPSPYRVGNPRKFINLALILGIIATISACKKKAAADEEPAPVVSVKVAKAERQPIKAQASALGTIFPREQATVSANINAQIKQMALLKNKPVRAGEVIAVLNSRDLQAQRGEAAAALHEAEVNLRSLRTSSIPQTRTQDVKALNDARANVANARALYERRVRLFEQGGIAQKDVEAAQLSLTLAENELRTAESAARLHTTATNPNDIALATTRVNQAQQHLAAIDTQLSYATIRAPISGVITDQFQYQGEYASAGGRLVTIADTNEVIVKAQFADTVVAQLTVGDEASVQPQDFPGEQIDGAVSLISRSSDPQNRTVEVWVKLKNEDRKLRANSAARVTVTTADVSDALAVPKSAVTLEASNGDEGTVMVVDEESVAHETKVQVGIRTPELMQITSGLKGGETVVIEGNYNLPDGTKVEVSSGEGEEGGEGEPGEEGGSSPGGCSTPNSNTSQPNTGSNNQSQPDQSGGANTDRGTGEKPATGGTSGGSGETKLGTKGENQSGKNPQSSAGSGTGTGGSTGGKTPSGTKPGAGPKSAPQGGKP